MNSQPGQTNAGLLNKLARNHGVGCQVFRIGVVFGCVCLLLFVLQLRLFETASANPIPFDTDEFGHYIYGIQWPPGITPPSLLNLVCTDESGATIYQNTIQCNYSPVQELPPCRGESKKTIFYQKDQASECKLTAAIQGRNYVLRFTRPLPFRCSDNREINNGIYCGWDFDFSDPSQWEGLTGTGLPPTVMPTNAYTPTPLKEDGVTLPGIQNAWVRFLSGLLLAWLVEIPVLLIMTRILFPRGAVNWRRVILIGLLMTLVTLPILWYVLPNFLSGVSYILIGEALVILIEAGILAIGLKISFIKALLMSLAANVASYLVGLWLL